MCSMMVRESLVRDVLRLLVWYPLRWLVSFAPVGFGLAVFRLMGDAHYLLSRGKRELLGRNLDVLWRDPALRAQCRQANPVRAYLRNHYTDSLFIFLFPRFQASVVERLVEFQGLEHLEAALAAGRGAILLHGHFGPVHLPLVCLARMGFPMKQIGLPSDEGLSWVGKHVAFRLRMQYEAKIPAQIIHARAFMRPVLTWLGQNGALMITGDGSGTPDRIGVHERLRFCGHPVMFPVGPARLAQKTGAALLPMFVLPGTTRRWTVCIEPALATGEDQTPAAIMQAFLQRYESHVARYPGHMHFLDRFTPGALIEIEPEAAPTAADASGTASPAN